MTDRIRFLEVLQGTLVRFSWRCLGYCLIHRLVRTPEPNLARGMRDLNGIYAQAFNRRHGRDGHLFRGRYRAVLIERDEHLLSAVAYIVRNPVRAGLCTSPGERRWSSHAAALGERPPGLLALDELLRYFAPNRGRARELHRGFTEDDAADGTKPYREAVIDGSDEFVLDHLADVEPSTDFPSARGCPPRPPSVDVLREGSLEANRDRLCAGLHHARHRSTARAAPFDSQPAIEPISCTDQDLTPVALT